MATDLFQYVIRETEESAEETGELESSEGFQRFGIDLEQFLLLSSEGERVLFQELEKNPENAPVREKIIKGNLRLVAFWTHRIKAAHPVGGLEFWDLFQCGTLGLIRAVERFDRRKGYKFSTYATWWIRQAIFRAIENTRCSIRVPVNIQANMRKFFRAQQELIIELGQEPSPEEMAVKMETSVVKVIELQRVITLGKLTSLDQPFDSDDEQSWLDILPAGDDTEETAKLNLLRGTIGQALELLGDSFKDERQKKVLRLRFGLENERPHTLEEVGREFGLTRERIRQIEEEALRRLRRKPQARRMLEGFVE